MPKVSAKRSESVAARQNSRLGGSYTFDAAAQALPGARVPKKS